jgi:hypothetical protein
LELSNILGRSIAVQLASSRMRLHVTLQRRVQRRHVYLREKLPTFILMPCRVWSSALSYFDVLALSVRDDVVMACLGRRKTVCNPCTQVPILVIQWEEPAAVEKWCAQGPLASLRHGMFGDQAHPLHSNGHASRASNWPQPNSCTASRVVAAPEAACNPRANSRRNVPGTRAARAVAALQTLRLSRPGDVFSH